MPGVGEEGRRVQFPGQTALVPEEAFLDRDGENRDRQDVSGRDGMIGPGDTPERVVEGCPSVIYPSPTSFNVLSFLETEGIFKKNSRDWDMVIFNTSLIFFPLYFTSRVSLLYRLPLQSLHVTYTSGRKFISMV